MARELSRIDLNDIEQPQIICRSPRALGNGRITGIRDVVCIKPEHFDRRRSVFGGVFLPAGVNTSGVFVDASAVPLTTTTVLAEGFGSIFLLIYLLATGKLAFVATTTAAGWAWILLTSALLYGYVFTFYEGLQRVPAT